MAFGLKFPMDNAPPGAILAEMLSTHLTAIQNREDSSVKFQSIAIFTKINKF